jgi:RimJ/RimL family protein N-acetyltransferase
MTEDLPALPSTIDTRRLRLRPLTRNDTESFRDMTDEPAITGAIDFLPTPFTLRDAERLIDGNRDGRDCFWGVWQNDNLQLIGTVGTHLRGTDEIEIGYWFATAALGHGFAFEAAAAIVAALLQATPNRRIFAECRPDNERSWRLLERMGFQADSRGGLRSGRKRLVFAAR